MQMNPVVLALAALLPLSVYAVEAAASDVYAGAYAGLYGGHASADDKGKGYDQDDRARNGWAQDVSPKGGVYGVKAGYSWILGSNLLLGVEADYEGRSKNEDEALLKFEGVPDNNFSLETELKQAASLRARLGYLFNDKGLVYLTGGYATVEAKRTWKDVFRGSESHSGWQDGWTAGVGAEYLLLDNVSAGLEYRYSDYGSENVDANLWEEYYKQELTEESLRVSVNYLF